MLATFRTLGVLSSLVLAAAPVGARQIEVSLEQSLGGESNVFRSSSLEIASGAYEIAPSVALVDAGETLDYSVLFRPSYEVFFNTPGLNGFDYDARAEIAWRPSAFDTVAFEQTYTNRRRLRDTSTEDPFETLQDVLANPGIERIARARTRLAYNRAFTQYWSGDYEAEFDYVDFSLNRGSDQKAFSSLLRLNYSPRSGTTFGPELLGRLRDFGKQNNVDLGSNSIVAVGSMVLAHELTETLVVEIRLGATFLREEQDDPSDFQTSRFEVLSSGGAVASRVIPAMPGGAPVCDSDIFGTPNFERCSFDFVDAAQLPMNTPVSVGAAGLRGQTSTRVFASGSALITKLYRAGFLSLEYVRGEAANSRDGSSNIKDTVSAQGVWKPTRDWRWEARATFSRWDSASDFFELVLPAVDSGVPTMVGGASNFAEVGTTLVSSLKSMRRETFQVWGQLSGRHFLTEQLSIDASFRYIYQKRDTSTSTSSVNALGGSLGFTYSFEPLVF